MHSELNEQNNKKLILIALLSAVTSFFFSFMSAPFIRLFAQTKAVAFWIVGVVLVAGLFVSKFDLVAIYVGAIWMTLGLYSRFELQGLNWKKSGILSVISGLCFAIIGFLFVTKGSVDHQLVKEMTEPIVSSFKQFMPEEKGLETKAILFVMPGILAATLLSALAVGLVFESQMFQAFNLKREKLASSLRWLEFRLPDQFIWISLFAFLFSIIDTPYAMIQTLAINISVFSLVAYFFQGIALVEYATRLYRFGRFSKVLLYMLIFTSVLPLVSFVGIIDYWVDFRRIMRKNIKA